MNTFISFIPYIEIVFILLLLGLSYLGYLSVRGEENQRNQSRFKPQWILSALVGLAIISLSLLLFVCFSQE